MPPSRARALLLIVAVAAYLNSLGNGFAYDDSWFIPNNEVVTQARFADAFTEPAWPGAREGTGNYRPIVLSSFAVEWAAWGGNTLGFHAMNVIGHALVALLVLALLSQVVTRDAALAGALIFAVQPVHVEAVANLMGRAEIYCALAYLGACLLYWGVGPARGLGRNARLLGLIFLFLLALGSKEMAVTLPGVLVVLELFRPSDEPVSRRLAREWPTYVALGGVLLSYILVRWNIMGDLTGRNASPGLAGLTSGERILTALTVWPEYLRLMVFPLDLSIDYAPAVLLVSRTVNAEVVLGGLLIAGLLGSVFMLRRRAPAAALGFAWFGLTILPASNLVVRADILLAERTLYLPSVGLALVLAAVWDEVAERGTRASRLALAGIFLVVGAGFLTRTVTRNPSWMDTFTVLSTLAREHPESWLAQRARAAGLHRVGDDAGAAEAYELALELAPDHYGLLVEVAEFYEDVGREGRAEGLFQRAIELIPTISPAYERLSEQLLRAGDGRAAHAVALRGLAKAGPDGALYALVSESYVAKGDLAAAVRARRAAIAQEPTDRDSWLRLATLLEAEGDTVQATLARGHAAELEIANGERG
jgi:protein O-mannosyl-transferase